MSLAREPLPHTNAVTFEATLPETQSAIKIGSGELRVTLVIPEIHMPAALPLVGMRGQVLRVSVEPLKNNGNSEQESDAVSAGAERKSRWQTA